MTQTAEKIVKKYLNRDESIDFQFEAVKEDPKIAIGNGTGIM
jgi:hypothetical protein